MKKSMWISVAFGAVSLFFLGVTLSVAQTRYADVIAVDPIYQTVSNPHEECQDVPVTQHREPRDQHNIAGTAIGAIAGGLLGNQVGGGKGKTLATIAGAAGGGYAGNRVQNHVQSDRTSTRTEHRCTTVDGSTQKIIGYNVEYEYNGRTRTVRMNSHPGDRVEVDSSGRATSR